MKSVAKIIVGLIVAVGFAVVAAEPVMGESHIQISPDECRDAGGTPVLLDDGGTFDCRLPQGGSTDPSTGVQDCNKLSQSGSVDPLLCPPSGGEEKINSRVQTVLNTVYAWVGIIAVIVIVISGVRYITSQGSPDAVKRAKSGILYASIGLIIVLAAFAITNMVLTALGG